MFKDEDIMEVMADEIGDFIAGVKRSTFSSGPGSSDSDETRSDVYRRVQYGFQTGWPNAEESHRAIQHKMGWGGNTPCL